MFAIAAAIPLLGLAALAWIIIGVRRTHPDGALTAATAAAWYAHVMILVGAVMSLVGGSIAVRAAFGFARMSFSYPVPEFYDPRTTSGPATSRDDDLTLGITLLVVGLLVLLAHALVVRAVAGRPGGSLLWISRGSLVLFTFFAGLVAVVATVGGVYESISYVRNVGYHEFGEPVGFAVMFLPAWIIASRRLMRTGLLHGPQAPAAPHRPVAGSPA